MSKKRQNYFLNTTVKNIKEFNTFYTIFVRVTQLCSENQIAYKYLWTNLGVTEFPATINLHLNWRVATAKQDNEERAEFCKC